MSEQENTVEVENAETTTTRKLAKKVVGVKKESTLKVLVDSNPKRPGYSAYERFENYFKDGINTVQDAIDAGLTMGDIKYDIAHEFIEVTDAEVVEYEPSARGPRGSNSDADIEGESLLEEGQSASESNEGDVFE